MDRKCRCLSHRVLDALAAAAQQKHGAQQDALETVAKSPRTVHQRTALTAPRTPDITGGNIHDSTLLQRECDCDCDSSPSDSGWMTVAASNNFQRFHRVFAFGNIRWNDLL
uniref:Uncharacterized protein n=1 Tax=Knipowitschia caucasica TaxID=637954 RepID=A0AAV2J2P2_KNICA